MRDRLDDARALLPGVRLHEQDTLGGSDRSDVRRVRAEWPGQPETAVIVKTFIDAGESWVREAAALATVPRDGPTARLIAEGAEPPIVVMTDVGTGTSVADALLGDDFDAGTEAVLSWAEAIATLHRTTLGARESFRAALSQRSGDLPVGETRMLAAADDASRLLEQYCTDLDVRIPPGALAELRDLPRRLNGDHAAALSPHDACPDNNVRIGDTLTLVDFEGAQWRHVAWDVAYLTVPWPSCWCSWRMPGDVSGRALERYRATIEAELPYVRTPEFRHDVSSAATGWALISTSMFLPKALGDDPPPSDPAKLTPTRRAMILHRLYGARRSEELPALAELADGLRDTLVQRWGEVPLAYAPAFEDAH
jgi:Phosphotransferase enzyme family